jgi:hypothetical protein
VWPLVAAAWVTCSLAALGFLVRLAAIVAGGSDPANPATDLAIYLAAADHLRTGVPIYQTQIDIARSGWPYVYPPLLAQAFLPFASSYPSAWFVSTAVSLACWLASLGALTWAMRERVWHAARPERRPVLLAGLVLWPSVLLDVFLGQVQLPLLALLCASWLALGARRQWTAGVLLGAAIAIKPLPAVALISLLAARHWRAVRPLFWSPVRSC